MVKKPNPFVVSAEEPRGAFYFGPEGCAVLVTVHDFRGPDCGGPRDVLERVVDELLRVAGREASKAAWDALLGRLESAGTSEARLELVNRMLELYRHGECPFGHGNPQVSREDPTP